MATYGSSPSINTRVTPQESDYRTAPSVVASYRHDRQDAYLSALSFTSVVDLVSGGGLRQRVRADKPSSAAQALLGEASGASAAHLMTPLQAATNMTKCVVGAASFALPWGFLQAGFWGGVVGVTLVGLISWYTIAILIKVKHVVCGDEVNITYGRVAAAVAGRWLGVVVDSFIVASALGICVAYLDFVSAIVAGLITGVKVWQILAVLFLPLCLLAWLRNFKLLSFTSIFGDLAFLAGVAVVVVVGFLKVGLTNPLDLPALNIKTFPLFFGISGLLFLFHMVAVPIEQATMPGTFSKALAGTMIFVTILNVAIGALGYMFYTSNVDALVITNLTKGTIVTIVQILLCADLVFSFGIVLAAPREIIELALLRDDTPNVEMKRNLIRALLVVVTCGLALAIPNFSIVANLVGGFCLCFIGLVLPPILHVAVCRKELPAYMVAFNILAALVGAAALVTTTQQSVGAIIDSFK